MRAYLPISWAQLAELTERGTLPGPLGGFVVDPAWRIGSQDVDEEEWEYEAQLLAAARLAEQPGVVLAVESAEAAEPDEGGVWLTGPIRRSDVAAVLTGDLAWFAVQEAALLLESRP